MVKVKGEEVIITSSAVTPSTLIHQWPALWSCPARRLPPIITPTTTDNMWGCQIWFVLEYFIIHIEYAVEQVVIVFIVQKNENDE